jgi:molybdate transport system permease protein
VTDRRGGAAFGPAEAAFHGATLLGAAALLALVTLPLVALLLQVRPSDLWSGLGDPAVIDALRLSLLCSATATALVVVTGLPTAYLLARHDFPGRRLVEVLVELPMVLPPTVAGFALLMAFGRAGLAGPALQAFGVTLPFTTLGVIVAQAFMAAPFFVAPARAGFASVDPRYLDAAATLRASAGRTFFHVLLPLSRRALIAGGAMCCARALGEFGATITFAGNLQGTTQTLPLAVYVALQSDPDRAVVLSVLLLATSFLLLLALRVAPAGLLWRRGDAGSPAR